jgi:hypothetical protein
MQGRTRFIALVLATALAGFLAGARWTPSGADLRSAAPTASGEYRPDPLRGGFWRPAGSSAERPEPSLALRPVTWDPAVRLASLD